MKYVIEKSSTMPLCAVKDNIYINYIDRQIINNKSTINFINEGLKKKNMKIIDIDLLIYSIWEYIMPTYDRGLIAYNYVINGSSNFVNYNKQPFSKIQKQCIIDKLISGKYQQSLIWGEVDE